MLTFKVPVAGLLLVSLSIAGAQGGKDVKPIPPELLEKGRRAHEAIDRGRAFLDMKQFDEAISAFREAVAIEATIPGLHSSSHYELAKALTILNRQDEALAEYKKAVQWREHWQDLSVNGPPFPYVQIDYAILLAKREREEEAKMLYYSVLSKYPRNRSSEPFPFLVVFDPDPTMVYWEYTPERFVAAAMMARATLSQKEAIPMTGQVLQMEPTWVVPAVYLGVRRSLQRDEYLSLAESLARNDEERGWVRQYQDAVALGGDNIEVSQRFRDIADGLAEIGVARRKGSTVLAQAKLDLEQNWRKIASAPGSAGAAGGRGGGLCPSCPWPGIGG